MIALKKTKIKPAYRVNIMYVISLFLKPDFPSLTRYLRTYRIIRRRGLGPHTPYPTPIKFWGSPPLYLNPVGSLELQL